MIKTVAFDLGGVIITIDNEEPERRLRALGIHDADRLLDPYVQKGIFGDLESGLIDEEQFRLKLSEHAGRELSREQCQWAWLGYVADVPTARLHAVEAVRAMGYRVVLASNTNSMMQAWAETPDFSADGKPIGHYFDTLYRSYEMRQMKPGEGFFRYMLSNEQIQPEEMLFIDDSARNCASASQLGIYTVCPQNGTDWSPQVMAALEAYG